MKAVKIFLTMLIPSLIVGMSQTAAAQVLEQDSLALVALYNSTDGANWTNTWDLNQPVSSWYGIVIDGGRVTAIRLGDNNLSGTLPGDISNLTALIELNLHTNELSGAIPPEFGSLVNLKKLYLTVNQLSGTIPAELGNLAHLITLQVYTNKLSDMPDFSGSAMSDSIQNFQVQYNKLTFEDIEPNVGIADYFTYSPQDSVGEAKDTTVNVGSGITFSAVVGGSANQYQWMRNEEDIFGADGSVYTIVSVGFSDPGSYLCKVTNTIVPGLTIYSRPIKVAVAEVSEQDSLALVALYDSTDGANWNNTWDLNQPFYSWYGITVDVGRVQEIELNENNLSGTLPEEICNLTALTKLTLRGNNLGGTLPDSIGRLTHLGYLHLGNNQLSGELPISFGNLKELGALWLDKNQFSGEIPETLYSLVDLQNLQIHNNQFTGQISESVGNLVGLEYLFLSGNDLSGTIPEGVGNLADLRTLELSWNQLQGSIPDTIANMFNLSSLLLSHNELNGPIPQRLGELSNLWKLELHSNHLDGSIPSQLGSLVNLETLFLTENELSGAIPPELGNLADLVHMYIAYNQLSGPIPAELGNLMKLQTLHLNTNELSDMPDFSGSAMSNTIQNFQVQMNKLTFEDIEPNVGITSTFVYSPQDSVGEEKDTTLDVGSSITFSVVVGGSANQYQWMKDSEDISGADSSSYTIASFDSSDAGSYICRITNTFATELTLYSRPTHVTIPGGVGVSIHSEEIPIAFALRQNYPNPFNPETDIRYQIPSLDSDLSSFISLKIYNILGQEVRTLVDEVQDAGYYTVIWDGRDSSGREVPSGVYFYRLTAGGASRQNRGKFTDTKRMLLVK